ncbi:hypothetical protein KKA49_00820 [Patescibacteria group bacterium]|nr:hypothetical protein [Patescibacteria group bacterium]
MGYNHTDSKKTPLLSARLKLYLSNLFSKELSAFIIGNSGFMQKPLKRYLKLTAFNRSFILNDMESANLLAKNIALTDPLLTSAFNQYLNAGSLAKKRLIAAKILVDYPLVYPQIGKNFDEFANMPISNLKQIDNYRRNWVWGFTCIDDRYKPENFYESEVDKKITDTNPINYLMKTVINYMIQNPSYSDPKLLHQIVNVGHYAACQDEETPDLSRQAFQLLHTRYPNTYWAKQTPYWY